MKSLIQTGANENIILHQAAKRRNVDLVDFLFQAGADVNVTDVKKKQLSLALHYAAKNAHLNVVESLVQKGANINTINNHKETELHCAVKAGHLDVVKFLSHKSIDFKETYENRRKVLERAQSEGHKDIVDFLGKMANSQKKTNESIVHLFSFKVDEPGNRKQPQKKTLKNKQNVQVNDEEKTSSRKFPV